MAGKNLRSVLFVTLSMASVYCAMPVNARQDPCSGPGQWPDYCYRKPGENALSYIPDAAGENECLRKGGTIVMQGGKKACGRALDSNGKTACTQGGGKLIQVDGKTFCDRSGARQPAPPPPGG